MKTIDQTKLLEKLMLECGLGEIIGDVESVSGGFMHRMYKVATSQGIYAVKHLNAEIMKRPDVFDNYGRAEKIEGALEQGGLPIVPALVFHGKKMQNVDGQFFYVFRWHNGKITDWGNISGEQCYMVGNILGKMHDIEPKNVEPEAPEVSRIDWQGYARKAKAKKSEIAALLEGKEELLLYAENELNRAKAALPAMRCISDEDMDPKNIMWENGSPWVIDLECLDYGNPMAHAVTLALQWAGTVTEALDTGKLTAFFEGYLEAYDNGFRGYGELFGLAYNWVDWLEYNIQRALGNCVDEAEQNLGISEVKNTIHRIEYLRRMEPQIKEALRTGLAKPDVTRYDTHEERLCYYELLLERDLSELPEYPLPAGYRFVPYSHKDRDTWIAIEQSAKEFANYGQGLEAWNRYYADNLDILPDRMFFIENDKGEKIATATAFYNIYGKDASGAGWLHWVAVKREYQGKGLSKPLITYVLKAMKKLGYTRAKIPTQTNTWLACKVYLDLGFLPIEKNLEHSYEGWKIIKALTGHPGLADMSAEGILGREKDGV